MQAHLPCLRRRGLTLPSRGRATSGFASCRPPLMSNVSRLMQLRVTVPIIAFALRACVPFPHARQTKPEIDGVITINGSPLAGAHVSYCAKGLNLDRCESFKETTTDRLGAFHLAGGS